MTMRNPPHPGLVVLQQCIKPLRLTITAAAEALGVPGRWSQRQCFRIMNTTPLISLKCHMKRIISNSEPAFRPTAQTGTGSISAPPWY